MEASGRWAARWSRLIGSAGLILVAAGAPAARAGDEVELAYRYRLLRTDPEERCFEVILVGDLFYSAGLARRVEQWLRGASDAGSAVLVGEPGRGFAIAEGMSELASYRVQVRDDLESRSMMRVRVLSMD